jgi:hypothetical protein
MAHPIDREHDRSGQKFSVLYRKIVQRFRIGLQCRAPVQASEFPAMHLSRDLGYDAEKSVWLLGMVIRQGNAVGFPAHES